ncbi:MAG: hypothetical protein IKR48_01210 [Kiritimatiellae bacterium]|nr:hypothetical protein [Kiritimatiellia bacterium]
MRTPFILPLSLATALSLLTGCMTTKERMQSYANSVSVGNYAAAEAVVKDVARDDRSDGLCWQLHEASAQQWQLKLPESLSALERAEDRFLLYDASSTLARGGRHAVAALSNDLTYPYEGYGQERIFCSLYKGLNYASAGRYDEARVELNSAGEWQDKFIDNYRKQIAEAEEKLRHEADSHTRGKQEQYNSLSATILSSPELAASIQEKCGYDRGLQVSQEEVLTQLSQSDYFNTYASHVRGVFRWLNGDNARGDLKQIAGSLPDSALAARDFAEYEKGVKPQGQAWIYVEDGLCPIRDEVKIHLPLGLIPMQRHILYTGMAFPKLIGRSVASSRYSIAAGGTGPLELEQIMDVDHLVKTEFDIFMRGAISREVVRLILRTLPQIVLAEAARRDDKNSGLWFLAQVGVAAYAAASMGADVRSWSALPKRVLCQRVPFQPGETLVLRTDIREIPIPMPQCQNAIVVVRYPAQPASPSVQFITFSNKQ